MSEWQPMTDFPRIVTGIGSVHLRHGTTASCRRLRAIGRHTVHEACRRVREQGARPISLVDDLTATRLTAKLCEQIAIGITQACLAEKVSCVGGEMAQMGDSYRPGYLGLIVFCIGEVER